MYSTEADAVREFFRDVLELPFVDVGRGWLIFAAPPTELAVHPDKRNAHELYLMCDDIAKTQKELEAKGVKFARPVEDQGWGLVTAIVMPGGAELGIYQPKHALAHGLKKS